MPDTTGGEAIPGREEAALPANWPAHQPLAVSVNVMLEGWTDDSAPGIGPMGNPLKAGILDLQARSWAEHGPRTGAWRILEILGRTGVPAVFYVSGIVAERHPALLRASAQAGHGVAAHSWAQNIIPAMQSEADETRDLARCVAVLGEAAGSAPRGWLSPRCSPARALPGKRISSTPICRGSSSRRRDRSLRCRSPWR